jgi:sulfur carrier protein ThiS
MQREKRLTDAFIAMNENGRVRDLLRLLDIETEDAAIVIVNGKSSTYKQVLLDGDRVTLISPLAGG